MSNLKLYEITNGFMDLNEKEELSEEERQEIGMQLADALQTKSNNIIAYYQDQNTLLNAIDEEIKRLQDYKKITKNKIDRYKEYVKSNMDLLGLEKISTDLGVISIAKSPISVEILDEQQIPDEYKEVVTTIKVYKKKIADNFKETGEIPNGVKINTDNTFLKIK